MFHLRSIGVLSSAKIFAVVQAAIGVIVGFCFLVFGAVGAALVPGQQKLGMIGIIVIAVLMPVFYGVLGLIMGAIWAFVQLGRAIHRGAGAGFAGDPASTVGGPLLSATVAVDVTADFRPRAKLVRLPTVVHSYRAVGQPRSAEKEPSLCQKPCLLS